MTAEPVGLAQRMVASIDRHGPMTFDRYMEAALYDEREGFYISGGRAGRRGDFLTSPEVGPLFGTVMAAALDQWWNDAGEPAVFMVVECGAGPGTLARSILAARPRCGPALRYVLVERSPAQRAGYRRQLSMEDPSAMFAATSAEEHPPVRTGPLVTSLPELPVLGADGVIIANELLDNLPVAVCERTQRGWAEVLIGHRSGTLAETLVPAPEGYRQMAESLCPEAPVGGRIPVCVGVWSWLSQALGSLAGGRLICIDYTRTTAEMAAEGGWLRCYRDHRRSDDPLEAPGSVDITCEVAIDQLARVAAPSSTQTQAQFLQRHGIDELVEEGRRVWNERAHIADVAALAARSRVREYEALTDPRGLGAFSVLEWLVAPGG